MNKHDRYDDPFEIKANLFRGESAEPFVGQSSSSPFISRTIREPWEELQYPPTVSGLSLLRFDSRAPASGTPSARVGPGAGQPTVAVKIDSVHGPVTKLIEEAARAAREHNVNMLLDIKSCSIDGTFSAPTKHGRDWVTPIEYESSKLNLSDGFVVNTPRIPPVDFESPLNYTIYMPDRKRDRFSELRLGLPEIPMAIDYSKLDGFKPIKEAAQPCTVVRSSSRPAKSVTAWSNGTSGGATPFIERSEAIDLGCNAAGFAFGLFLIPLLWLCVPAVWAFIKGLFG